MVYLSSMLCIDGLLRPSLSVSPGWFPVTFCFRLFVCCVREASNQAACCLSSRSLFLLQMTRMGRTSDDADISSVISPSALQTSARGFRSKQCTPKHFSCQPTRRQTRLLHDLWSTTTADDHAHCRIHVSRPEQIGAVASTFRTRPPMVAAI
jgi:hypothetical protein